MTALLLKFPSHILGFLAWWLLSMPHRIFHWFEELLGSLDNKLQLLSNFRLWLSLEPLFGDYGWKGRMIGFLFRGVRTIISLIAYLIIIGLWLAAEAFWILLLPAAIGLIFGFI